MCLQTSLLAQPYASQIKKLSLLIKFFFRNFISIKQKRCRCWCNKIYWLPPQKKNKIKWKDACSIEGKLIRHVQLFWFLSSKRSSSCRHNIKRTEKWINRNLFNNLIFSFARIMNSECSSYVFTLHCTICNKISACIPLEKGLRAKNKGKRKPRGNCTICLVK